MSWQDDLRQLDQALAMGQIAADDYRKRRDQLLAAAAGSAASPAAPAAEQPSAPQQPAPQQPTPPPPPAQQPGPSQGPDSGPFAPPFRWEPSSDATQVVPGDSPDRTQVVGPVHSQDADRTQVFQPLGQQRSTAQPPWGQQQPGRPEGAPPPWGDDQYGQPVSGLNPTWLTQGPEVFESSGEKKSGTFLKIAIALVVVIGIGVGAFFIIRGQGDDNQPQGGGTTTQSQPPTSTSRPKDDLEIATLPGQAAEKADVKEFSDVEATDVLKDEEKTAYKNAGADKARLVTSNLPRSIGALVMTVEVTSAETAKSGTTQLAQLQKSFTMKDYTGTVPAGVLAQQFAKSESLPAVIRGHYRHKNTIVRVQVAGDDMAQISKVFDEILAAQLAELPADA